MRFSVFDFDVITTPEEPTKSSPKRGNAEPAPEQRRGEREPADPPVADASGETLR